MKEYNLKINISDIEVDDSYYSFLYEVSGDIQKKERYESDHSWYHDQQGFMDSLSEGHAFKNSIRKNIRIKL